MGYGVEAGEGGSKVFVCLTCPLKLHRVLLAVWMSKQQPAVDIMLFVCISLDLKKKKKSCEDVLNSLAEHHCRPSH